MDNSKISNNYYKPGKCNIGPKEVNVRKKFLWLFSTMTVLCSAISFFMYDSKLLWLTLLASSFSTLVLFSEIYYKFCVIFGFFSLHNFKELGNLDHVSDANKKKEDHRRVLKTLVTCLFFALSYSAGLHYVILMMRS